MTGATHLACGIAASFILCNNIIGGILLSVGAILPDIDTKNSILGRALPFIPKIIKHRTLTHSIIFLCLTYFINIYLFYGCCIHIILDMMTMMGCPLFYPLDCKIRFPMAKIVQTGGNFEMFIHIIAILFILYQIMFKLF